MPISRKPYAIERIISAATYLTAGGVGFVWLIIAAVLRKTVTPFVMYHILQSIFLSVAYLLISIFGHLIYIILARIPLINVIPYLINMPLGFAFGLSIVQLITTTIILYLSITAGMGLYSYFPWFSDIINGNLGRK